jgi:dipeptidyl aminopeptidase/acylaminoacyl peptidase
MKPTTAVEANPPKPRRLWRILKRVLLSLLLLAVILIFGVFPYLIATFTTNARTRPQDRALSETPATYGAQFEDVEFETSDGVKISGWLLKSRDKRATIIYSHGLFRSRRELLERAVELWRLGYGALLYDARNHGQSGPARCSLGYWERLDAEGAVRFLGETLHTGDRIVLYGISMGATAALLAAADSPAVRAVVADSSFLNFKDTTDHHINLFLRLPAFPLANEIRFFIEQRAGFDGSKLDALDAVRRIGPRPVFFIAAAHDRRMPPDIAERLYEAAQSPKRDLMIVEGPGSQTHGHAYQADPKLYITRVARFLDSALLD